MAHKRIQSTPIIHVRLKPELKRRIEEAAKRMGLTPSTYIRLVLVERLGLKPAAATVR